MANLQLGPGEPASTAIVSLTAANAQYYPIPAEDVRAVPDFNFTQVTFRLPNNLAVGTAEMHVVAHSQSSNIGVIRTGTSNCLIGRHLPTRS